MEHESGIGADVFGASSLTVQVTLTDDERTYRLCARDGTFLGVIYRDEVAYPRTTARKVADWSLEWVRSKRAYNTIRLRLVAADETPLLTVVFPGEDGEHRSVVANAAGDEVGEVLRVKGLHKSRFDLVAGGSSVGTVAREDWWGGVFRIEAAGKTVGSIKTQHARVRRTPVTTEAYVLELDPSAEEPLRALVLGALVGLDVSITPPPAEPS